MQILKIDSFTEKNDPPFLKKENTWVRTKGLIDLQVNGFAGVDFNTPGITRDSLEYCLKKMLASGVTTCLPTIITASLPHLKSCLSNLESARKSSELAKTMIPGYHLEGPFISKLSGFSGCHPVDDISVIDEDVFSMLQDAAGGNINLVTLAPELEGALEFIKKLVHDGIIVALGHTAAGSNKIREAIKAGASLSTHLGNGTSSELTKDDNPIVAQLGEDELSASFIADGYHIPPNVLKVYLRSKCSERIVLISDATAGASAKHGSYRLGNIEILAGSGPVIYDKKTLRPLGSVTTLDQCVRNVMNWYNISLEEAVSWASENPLKIFLSSNLKSFLNLKEQKVWWKKGNGGWNVKAAQSGDFLFLN